VEEIHTFTALSGGTRANGDAEHSNWIAREMGIHNHQVVFGPDDVPTPEEWLRLLWLTETPMAGPEVYYKHELHRFARHERPELRGMLLGAASDEFNGGYSHDVGSDWGSFLKGLSEMDRTTLLDQHPKFRHWWADGESFLSDYALDTLRGGHDTDVYRTYVQSEYRKVQQYNVWHEDRTAAGSGIEARVPFLDHRLVELTSVIPSRLRPRLLWDKRILRDAVKARVPSRIAERPKVPFFYGSGTGHAYRMLVRLMRSNGQELVERALAAPGADSYLDGSAIRRQLAGFGSGDTDAPSVELLMRVVNMGLLAEMAAQPPQLDQMTAGPVRSVLPAGQDPMADTEELFEPAHNYDLARIPVLAKGLLLLTDADGDWYLANDGQLEFVLEPDSPIVRVLRHMDGESPLASVLSESRVALEDVRTEFDALFDQQLIAFAE
jgi:asparagine synthase (glutamine-hydrolysing)